MKSHERLQEKIWKRKKSTAGKNTRIAEAAKLLSGGERLLDIGCGHGDLTDYVGNIYKKIYGIDVSATALREANRKGMITKKLDLGEDRIPHPAKYFDSVVCLDVVIYIRDPEFLVDEVWRVMKSGGVFIISFPNVRALSRVWSLWVRGKFPKTSGDCEGWDGGHLHYFTTKDVRHLLEKKGFRVDVCKGMLPEAGRGKNAVRLSSRILGRHISREFILHGTIIRAIKI